MHTFNEVSDDRYFSDAEKAVLVQFRSLISDVVQPEHDDYELIRWLRARNLDMFKAEDMFRKSLKWREEWQVDSIRENYHFPEVAKMYLPWSIIGNAKDGSPVYLLRLGKTDVKGAILSISFDEYIRCTLKDLEKLHHQTKVNTTALGKRITQHICIMDLEGSCMIQVLDKQVAEMCKKLTDTYDNNYPESVKIWFIINTHPVLKLFIDLMSSLLSEVTLKKIRFFGRNSNEWKQALLKEIDAEVLPVTYGGTRRDPDGNPACPSLIVEGGAIPKSYYMKEKVKADELFTSLAIKRKASTTVDIQVVKAGCDIKWEYITEDYDIGFGIQFGGEYIVPIKRASCNGQLICGQIRSEKSGKYTVVFDNSHSLLRSKQLWYKIDVL